MAEFWFNGLNYCMYPADVHLCQTPVPRAVHECGGHAEQVFTGAWRTLINQTKNKAWNLL